MNRKSFLKAIGAASAALCTVPKGLAEDIYLASKYEVRQHPYLGFIYVLQKTLPRRNLERTLSFESPEIFAEIDEMTNIGKQDGLKLHCQFLFPHVTEFEIGCEFYK